MLAYILNVVFYVGGDSMSKQETDYSYSNKNYRCKG